MVRQWCLVSAVLLVMALSSPGVAAFTDVSPSAPYATAVQYLSSQGVVTGCGAGNFCGNQAINRAEAVKILVVAAGGKPGAQYQNCFTDVKNEWFAKYVCWAKEAGWVKGFADGSFKPAQVVNRAEALKLTLLSRRVNLADSHTSPYSDVRPNDWFYKYVTWSAYHNLLTESGTFVPAKGRTRGTFVLNLYRLITVLELRRTVYDAAGDAEMAKRPLRPAASAYFTAAQLCADTGGAWRNQSCACPVGAILVELAGCQKVAGGSGAICGGIAALPCASGLVCRYEFSYPDASGTCVQPSSSGTITAAELAQGWYYGYSDQKKAGTPAGWTWLGAGKDSQWHK